MKARLVERRGSFSPAYYAVAVTVLNLKGDIQEVALQCPAFAYPYGKEDEGTNLQEGLNETARKFFQALVDQINSEACSHHWNNGGECAP